MRSCCSSLPAAVTTRRILELNAQLLDAARANRVEQARELIERGADVNAKDETEQSAYLYATSEVGPGMALLELTIAKGADINAKDSYNGTGLIRPRIADTRTSCDA